jgi:acetyl-CoA carboxylase carboxyltransferase component
MSGPWHLEKFMTPYSIASKRQLDILIRPQETRPQIIKALGMLENKKGERTKRKHGNIPL